jgi:hypothetical protein
VPDHDELTRQEPGVDLAMAGVVEAPRHAELEADAASV